VGMGRATVRLPPPFRRPDCGRLRINLWPLSTAAGSLWPVRACMACRRSPTLCGRHPALPSTPRSFATLGPMHAHLPCTDGYCAMCAQGSQTGRRSPRPRFPRLLLRMLFPPLPFPRRAVREAWEGVCLILLLLLLRGHRRRPLLPLRPGGRAAAAEESLE
jgi:hypothetical protein